MLQTPRRLLMVLMTLGLSIAACAPAQVDSSRDAGPAPMPSAGTPLSQVDVPETFDFEATARVDIHVQAPPQITAGSSLVISRSNGAVIYRGAVPASRRLTIAYPLPTHEHELLLTYRAADGSKRTDTLQVGEDETATSTLGQEETQ